MGHPSRMAQKLLVAAIGGILACLIGVAVVHAFTGAVERPFAAALQSE